MNANDYGGWDMLRKAMIALFAMASVAVLAPGTASARGGHGGGGFGGGGFRSAAIGGGGWHGGFRHRGFPFAAAAVGLGVGYGLYGYGYNGYDYGYYGAYPAAYDDSYYYGDDGGCYVVRQRVMTRYGWRIRPVQVCN
jgi:hypothetical protein